MHQERIDNLIKELSLELYEDDFKLKEGEFSRSFTEILQLFCEFITIPINKSDLDGLNTAFFTAVENFYKVSVEEKRIYINTISSSFDALLKKVLFIIDKSKFNQAISSKWMLKKLIIELNLLGSNSENILWDEPVPITDKTGFPTYLQLAYKTRNKVHEAKDWSNSQLAKRFTSCLITYTYVIAKYYDQLNTGLVSFKESQEYHPDIDPYLENLKQNIQADPTFSKRYIDIEGLEDRDIIETNEDIEEDSNEQDELFKSDVIQNAPVRGKISELKNQFPQMVIKGSPGMGKSTTLKYLALTNSINKDYIPYYVELKNYEPELGIIQQISTENQLDLKWINKTLQSKEAILYLDGYNEILDPQNRNKVKREINNFIRLKYQFLLTTRPLSYDTDHFKISVFDLLPLNDDQIRDYANRAFQSKEIIIKFEGSSKTYNTEGFLTLLKKHKSLYDLCKNPFFLKIYINVILRVKSIPENTGLLMRTFVKGSEVDGKWIDGLIEREKSKDEEFSNKRLEYESAIQYIAFQTRLKNGVSFSKARLESLVRELNRRDNSTINPYSFLNIFTDLYLIRNDNNKISFVHELYQEYLAAEELIKIRETDHDLFNNLAKQVNWEEPMILTDGLLVNDITTFKLISSQNPLAAARAITSSFIEQPEKKEINIQDAKRDAKDYNNPDVSARGFLALMELGENETLLDEFVKSRVPVREKKQIIRYLQKNNNPAVFINFITIIIEKIESYLLRYISNVCDYKSEEVKQTDYKVIYEELKKRGEFKGIYSMIQRGYVITNDDAEVLLRTSLISKLHNTSALKLFFKIIREFNLGQKDILLASIKEILNINSDERVLYFATYMIEKYSFNNEFSSVVIVDKLLNINSFSSLKIAMNLIKSEKLENTFAVNNIIERMRSIEDPRGKAKAQQWAKEHRIHKTKQPILPTNFNGRPPVVKFEYQNQIISLFRLRLQILEIYEKTMFNTLACQATGKKIIEIFPHKNWWINRLIYTGCIKKLDEKGLKYRMLRYPDNIF